MKKYYFLFILVSLSFFILKNSHASTPSDFGLKEGDLISAIFSDDPDVYIVNEHGYKRLFLNPEIFKFYTHLGGFANIKLVTPEVRDSFPTVGLFRNCEDNDQKVFGTSIEGEDSGRLHWINKSGDQAVQEDPEFFKKVFCINRKEFNWYPRGTEFKALKEVPQYHRTEEAEKPVICHHPSDQPNEPKNFQTIRVAPESLDAHFQHGDTKGACSTTPVLESTPTITQTPSISIVPIPIPITTPVASYLIKPMVLKDILKVESVIPYDVANLGFGVYKVSAQYNLGAYHQGKWYEGLNPGISEAVWIEFGWPNTLQVDVVLRDENDQQRRIYLPATGSNKNPDGSSSNWYYWISEDGSSYYARKDHNYGWSDLSSIDALRPEHIARKAGGISTPTPTHSITPTLTPIPTPTSTLTPTLTLTPTPVSTPSTSSGLASSPQATPTPTLTLIPTALTPPTSVSVSLATGKIAVTWLGGSTPKYTIYRSVNGGTYQIWYGFITNTYYDDLDGNLNQNSSYRYKVYGCDSGGYNCSTVGTESNSIIYTSSSLSCTGLNLTLNDGKTTYILGADSWVNYTWTCTPGGNANYVAMRLYKPDGSSILMNTSGSFPTQTMGLGTETLKPGTHILKACFDENCSDVKASQTFTIINNTTPTPTPTTSSVSYDNFSRNLAIGSFGSDVKQLQAILVNEVGYSANLITGYFGSITQNAIKRLQEKYGVRPVSGYFGAITRQKLQALLLGR